MKKRQTPGRPGATATLRAYCGYEKRPGMPKTGLWRLSSGISENLRERFRALSSRAGAALHPPKGTVPEDFWLHRLYLNLRKNNSDQLFAVSYGVRSALVREGISVPDTAKPRKSDRGGVIRRVCVASATFCSRLERQALEAEHAESRDEEARPAASTLEARKKQTPLTERESKILAVIRQGLKGLQYCRELERAGVRPRRNRAWHGCPGTYAAAYQAGEPWRHRIQDEKSKVRKKAELAKN